MNQAQKVCRNKIQYGTRKNAWKWAIYYFNAIGSESAAYKCRICHKFHLTSKMPMILPKKIHGKTVSFAPQGSSLSGNLKNI